MGGRVHPVRLPRCVALLLSATLCGLGCSTLQQTVPEVELERLLELRQTIELTQDQAARLHALLQDYRQALGTLTHHLLLETKHRHELSASGASVWSAPYVTQVSLVHQLRAEQTVLPLLLRDQARTLLSREQRRMWDEDRLGRAIR